MLVEAIVFLNWTTFAIKLSIKTRLTSETVREKEEPNDRNQHQIGYLFIVVHALVSCALCHVVYLLKSLSVCLWLYSTFWHILLLFFISLFFRFNVNKSDAFAINKSDDFEMHRVMSKSDMCSFTNIRSHVFHISILILLNRSWLILFGHTWKWRKTSVKIQE